MVIRHCEITWHCVVGYKGGSWLTWGHCVQTHLGLGLVITWPLGHAPLSSNHRLGHAYLVMSRPYYHAHFRARVRVRVRVSCFVTSRPRPLIIQSPLRPRLTFPWRLTALLPMLNHTHNMHTLLSLLPVRCKYQCILYKNAHDDKYENLCTAPKSNSHWALVTK